MPGSEQLTLNLLLHGTPLPNRHKQPDSGGGQTDRQTDRKTESQPDRQTFRKTDRQIDRQEDRQTDRQTDIQEDRELGRQKRDMRKRKTKICKETDIQ
jgi:hypothetical protein